jgi:PAS domain S-box-containing protein
MAQTYRQDLPLSDELERVIERMIATRSYRDRGEVIAAALRLLETESSRSEEEERTEAELREVQERFSKAFNASPHLITITTYDRGRYLDVNEAVLRASGYTREEVIGHTDVQLGTYSDPSQREKLSKEIAETGSVRDREVRFRAKDGRILILLVSTEIVFLKGIKCVLSTSVDITERREAEARAETQRRLLLDELNHRVKNTLATVQSIARQTLRMAENPKDFISGFSARLMALARAHDLLTRKEWKGVSLEELLRQTIAPYGAHLGNSRIQAKGEHIELPPNTAVVLNMVLHELATNAAKYGALSKPNGVVSVDWSIDTSGREPHLTLNWIELGGPPVEPPKRKGFGTRLIERGLASELNGMVTLDYAPSGLRCMMELSIRHPRRPP